jgi:hypothetical protein
MRRVVITLALLASVCGILLFLFREKRTVDAGFGEVTYVWRWGIASHMKADRNRDGNVDLIVTWNEGRQFVTSTPPRHLLADTNFDASFDLRVTYYPEKLVEIDSDGDGVFETKHRGEEAAAVMSQLSFRTTP